LISGRPISFKMDLYNPLYVPRPTVEPELFASLRPPTYDGGFNGRADKDRMVYRGLTDSTAPFADTNNPVFAGQAKADPRAGFAPPREKREAESLMLGAVVPNDSTAAGSVRLQRELAARIGTASVGSAATGGKLGDYFQYAIDHPVSLARQKSAMLPIVGKDVEGTRVSIYNPAVQPKHPLLGLRFKNTSGMHLSQGPITVFEGSTYAGDTRVLDVQPGEERLVSYAIDLGTEVDPQNGPGTSRITNVKAVKGIVTTTTKVREEKKYRVANRSQTDRTLVIEHPNRTNQQFKLVETAAPVEDTAGVYRFQIAVKAGGETTFPVTEERDVAAQVVLTNNPDQTIRFVMNLNEATPALKAKLAEALKLKGAWDGQLRELTQVKADLARLATDQDRIRKNLAATPREAEVYQTYLARLATQEREIDGLTTRERTLMAAEFQARKGFEDYLANLTD
ncbi:MAG TPA: DUF4139 domain-containing protein, partial [Urbifossiella sp.]|nr:DUF4139 domain-containing protein [Urbifossiella sp.]